MATDTTPEPPLPRVSDIKLIVSDVDGTLLDSHHELQSSNPTHIVLRRIRQAHPSLPIVLSTGKPYPATAVLRDQLDLHPFHAVHLNGNVIYAPSNPVTKEEGKILSQTGLDADVVLAVYDTLKKAGISLFIYDVGGPWHVLPFKTVGDIPWDVALRAYGEDVQTIDRAEEAMARVKNGEFKVVKMAVCEVAEYLPTVRSVIGAFPSSSFATTQALPFCLELIPAEHHKGTALVKLLDILNSSNSLTSLSSHPGKTEDPIQLEDVLAFGDGGNDVAMLQLAGYSVAMSNAMPAAETVARYRTGSNDEGGVGMWLERVFFPSG